MSVRILPNWYARTIENIQNRLQRLCARGLIVRAIGFDIITLRERDAITIEDHVDFDALCRRHFKFGEDQALKYVAVAKHYSRQDLKRCQLGVSALAALAEVTPLHRQIIIELAGDNSVAELQRAAREAAGIASYEEARAVITAILQPSPLPKGPQGAAPPRLKPVPPLDQRMTTLNKVINRVVLELTLACQQLEEGDSLSGATLQQILLRVAVLNDLVNKLRAARATPPAPPTEERRQTPRSEAAAPEAPSPTADPGPADLPSTEEPEAAAAPPPPAASPEETTAAPPAAPADPDAALIKALKALDHPTRDHICEQLYLIMTDGPVMRYRAPLEQIPALCRAQGVALPQADFERWLAGISQWDHNQRGKFTMPFFIKAKLPGWRRRLGYVKAASLPEPFRTDAWAAWTRYPEVIPITWEDILQHYGPRPDGTMPPYAGPIPLRYWPTDED